ncbi:MAG: VCBS repeat-containing protein [Deltaproteobacteria bacterium]|nr:VCBS repeat-containing protein [Deltaproteobacteria bacterium]
MRIAYVGFVIALALCLPPGCDCGGTPTAGDCDGGPCPGDAGPDACLVVCAGICCGPGETCLAEQCVQQQQPCSSNEECQNDTCCTGGVCAPYGAGKPCGETNPECTKGLKIGIFAPIVKCEWTGPPAGDLYPQHRNVLSTPAVIDFKLGGTAGAPSIVFVSYNGTDTGMDSCSDTSTTLFGIIRVISGLDCSQQFTIASPRVIGAAPVALADLDGDGRAEIVAARHGGGVVAFRYDTNSQTFREAWSPTLYTDYGTGMCWWNGPSVHDVNDDGAPEILFGGAVYDATGHELGGPFDCYGADVNEAYCTLLSDNLRPDYDGIGQVPVAARLTDAAVGTLIDGANLWQLSPATHRWGATATNLGRRGQIAVADFGTFGPNPAVDDRTTLDGTPEIVVVYNDNLTPDAPQTARGRLRIMTLAGRVVFGPLDLPGGGLGGPPTVGDFDGDGLPEVAVAGWQGFTVFDPDCTGAAPDPVRCAAGTTDGVLWTRPSQDQTSSSTGSSIFDFDGDGRAEVIYADECFARVYDGLTGDVLYSQFHNSATWYENPIVADVDGDGKAELVIPSNVNGTVELSCETLDPIFGGIRCKEPQDCPNLLPCEKAVATDDFGLCRCQSDHDCGDGFLCRDPLDHPEQGQVCRAAHPGASVQGVRVISDRLDRWVAARTVWNQHAYSITNVGDFGEIPKTASWEHNWSLTAQPRLNNFRQNVPGVAPGETRLPDLTVRQATGTCHEEGGATLSAEVCNRGTLAASPVWLSFIETEPVPQVLCSIQATAPLSPGACVSLTCEWDQPPVNVAISITARADDTGTGAGALVECIEGNNLDFIEGMMCGHLY